MGENRATRTLTESEAGRSENLERLRDRLEKQGWRATELTIPMEKVGTWGLAVGAAMCLPLLAVWLAACGLSAPQPWQVLAVCVGYAVLIPLHEGVHGLTWALCNPRHFKAIEFGFMREYLTPYCTSGEPMSRAAYLAGSLMPLIVLGIAPAVAGIVLANGVAFVLGLLMVLGASGDVLVAARLVRHGASAGETLCVDHPSECGLVVFER